jgi:predicted TIM-barrel fold metal-dependent hydrolase
VGRWQQQGEGPLDREGLLALYDRLQIPGIVDAHCHFMPEDLQARVWRWFDEEAPVPWPITYRGSEAQRRRWLAELGVVRYTALAYAHRPGMARALNAWSRELLERDPKVIGSGTFFPEPDAAETVEEMLRDPRVRAFKLHLQVGGFHPDDPLLHPCYEQIRDAGRVVILHAGSAPLPGAHTGFQATAAMLERFPGLKVVIAHLGASETEAFLDLAARRPNLYFDTAMVFVDFWAVPPVSAAVKGRLVRLQDRILFGSDYPTLPYPFEHQVEALGRLNLGDGWLKAVLRENALRLFGGQG